MTDEDIAETTAGAMIATGLKFVAPRQLAESLIAAAGGLLVAASGRDDAARTLREIAARIEIG